jgi:transcriptional coactivator HFI1/ADA1
MNAAPRIDVEPIYTQLKGLISDYWQLYKQTVADFVIGVIDFAIYCLLCANANLGKGKRNQAEMAWIIDPFIKGDPQKESLHNQLIMSIFANSQREPPELPGVASWVSAKDKPTTQSKAVSGDAAELRLKSEIMILLPRERHRIKLLQEVCYYMTLKIICSTGYRIQLTALPNICKKNLML